MDYSKLEGKVIDVDIGSRFVKGKVILIEPNIGLTIVSEEDPDWYLVCLIMEGSPKWKDVRGNPERGKALFASLCEQIERGKITGEEIGQVYLDFEGVMPLYGDTPTADSCAF